MRRKSFCGSTVMSSRPTLLYRFWELMKRLRLSQINPEDKTGTWVHNGKKIVKVSDKIPRLKIIQDWMKQCDPKKDAKAFAKAHQEEW